MYLFYIFISIISYSIFANNQPLLFEHDHPIINELLSHHGGNINHLVTMNQNGRNSVSEIKQQLAQLSMAEHKNFKLNSISKISDGDLKRIQDGALYYFAQLTKVNPQGEIPQRDWSVFQAVKKKMTTSSSQKLSKDKGVRYFRYLDSLSQTGSVQAINELAQELKQQKYYLKRPSETYQILLLTQQILQGSNKTTNATLPHEIAPKNFHYSPLSVPFYERFSQHQLLIEANKRLLQRAKMYRDFYHHPSYGLKERQHDFLLSFSNIITNIENIKNIHQRDPLDKKQLLKSEKKTAENKTQITETPLRVEKKNLAERKISSFNNQSNRSSEYHLIKRDKNQLIEVIISVIATAFMFIITFYTFKYLQKNK